jgi:uncharacterized protein (TIGR02246 family)
MNMEWSGDMSVEDRLFIEDVIATYSYTWDSRDADGWAGIFTDDAVVEFYLKGESHPNARIESRTALREFAAERFRGRGAGQPRHYQTGTMFLELTADTARTRTMTLVTQMPEGETVASVGWTGIYEDDWRKTSSGWKMSRRAFHEDRTV